MNSVVYLIDQPLDQRNYDRFGIQTWVDRGWVVKVWDLTPLAQPRAWQAHLRSKRKIVEFSGYMLVESARQLKEAFAQSSTVDCYVDFCGDGYFGVRSRLRLSSRGALRIVCSVGSIPDDAAKGDSGINGKIRKVIDNGLVRSSKLLFKVAISGIVARWAPPGLFVVSGNRTLSRLSNRSNCEILTTHNLDYDIYLRLRASPAKYRHKYAVFLDQDLCFHPEYTYESIPPYATPNSYFPILRAGLGKISKALGFDLRIAAHPRSNYSQQGSQYFGDIPVGFGETAELIRDCTVVVGHCSTVIQLAVLFGKPIIFVTTDELARSPIGLMLERFAAELGKTPINLNSDLESVDWHAELSLDVDKYAEYRRRHIKIDGTPEVPHWEIIINHLEQQRMKLQSRQRTVVAS